MPMPAGASALASAASRRCTTRPTAEITGSPVLS